MSDPVPNVDIEDVLSSIRKLVSQDGRGEGKPVETAEESGPDRLVLTPAHRVIERPEDASETAETAGTVAGPSAGPDAIAPADIGSDDAAEPEATPMPTDAAAAPETEPASDVSLAGRSEVPASTGLMAAIAELEAAVDETGGEWEPDGSETVTEIDWEAVGDPALSSRGPAEMPVVTQRIAEPAASDETGPEPDEVATAGPDPAAVDADSTLDTGSAPGPVAALAGDADPPPAAPAEPLDGAAMEVSETLVVAPDEAEEGSDEVAVVIGGAHGSVGDAVNAPDLVAVAPDDAAGLTDPAAQVPDHTPDAAELPSHGDERIAEEPAFEDGADLDDDFDAYLQPNLGLDEDVLRELVAEIVRRELQGTLGERITRNVRKLVRREIYRILASEDFD